MVRNDRQSRGLAMAAALTCHKKLAKLATRDNLQLKQMSMYPDDEDTSSSPLAPHSVERQFT
ncbi:hypothetical protein [Streptomyces sp. NPDC091371]|uniref:hypothetical protein n=1 Tax=Streptomyces sp. NPDC091371 TaxID=3155303 RepID=UPI003440576E